MNVKTDTQNLYFERINKVILFINNHLGDNLDVESLAQVGNYSSFHFHRIMRAHLGESLGAYIIRRRLEASLNLLRYSILPITDVAFKVGYENPASFNKAFKKRYQVTPVEFRKNYNSLIISEDSKIKFNAMENLKSLKPKIKVRKSQKVIFVQAIGAYNESAGKAWDRVCECAKEKRLFGFSTEFIGISHDDPKVTEASKLRYDACIVVSKEVKPEGELGVQELQGGKYAVFTHKGPYEKFTNSYDYIFGKWLNENEIELRDAPSFEKYLNTPGKVKPEKLLTEIWVPIK
ncbi:MAG: AraC family transcriptional regulator [Prolixibacteraceae bacterium]|nr:AraC family transcriptional regulator [Prolixibacteraceae bacterium]MBN2774929.1 AraC family transcriptional regulator [Prolixibacteraceae bacterium]